MTHARQQIREAAATALTGLATTGSRVYQSRVHPLADSNLPCLLVNTDDEQLDQASIGMPPLLQRQLELRVRAVAKVTASLDDTLDAMLAEVETVLGNTTLGGKVKVLAPQAIRVAIEQGEKPVGIAELIYVATYHTAQNAPETIL